jgi:hypothetical protein
VCGDGVREGGEACDGADLGGATCAGEGFVAGTLGCDAGCGLDTTACTTCGDAVIDPGETCDGAALGGETCVTRGFDAGTLGCAADCAAFDTAACTTVTCGDGAIGGVEVCDGATLAGATCESLGFAGGALGCLPTCGAYDTSGCLTCGNDVRDGDDACDGADLGGATCVGEGFGGGTLACTAACALDTSGCDPCGNGVVDPGEACDGAALAGQSCGSQGFEGGTLACNAACTGFVTTACFACGDGAVNPGEVCDGAALAGQTCATQGFDGGTLACDAACAGYVTTACFACGDGTANGGEVCDGADLEGQTCATQGFDGGTLACDAACAGFVTTGCFACGDGTANPGEACDGADLEGQTCATQGFDGGTLACDAACAGFVTTGCFACGDGTVNPGEACDGADLEGQTCAGLGYDGGMLGCTGACGFDLTDCYACGDGLTEGPEVCDGADLAGESCASLGFDEGTLDCNASCTGLVTAGCGYTCGDGGIDPGEACDGADLGGETCAGLGLGFLSGSLVCGAGCGFDTSACSIGRPPALAGEVVITEFMPDPSVLSDASGEWFEVRNTTADPLTLKGCVVSDLQATPSTFTITTDLVIAAGAVATFASSASPGFTPDYVYPSFPLANVTGLNTDAIQLSCGGTLIDAVVYSSAFSWATGRAASLDPDFTTATGNDTSVAWCPATTTYGAGATPDRGSPGVFNPDCLPEVCTGGLDEDGDGLTDCADTVDCGAAAACQPLPIGFCRLQFPDSLTLEAGTSSGLVYGRVYVAGLTDQSTGNDLDPRVQAAVGVGPDGSDPAGPGWTWTAAQPNPGYPGAFGEANNDEYMASFNAPPAGGSYDYAFRFSGDGGVTWLNCDRNVGPGSDGSQDGYQAANAGSLTVTGGVTGAVYVSEYVEGSSSNKALEIFNGTSAALDLSGCAIRSYINGSTTATTLTLTTAGTLAAGGTYVVCNSLAGATLAPRCNLLSASTVMGFNGDDALELACGGLTLDILGQIGLDPGAEWGAGVTSTADNTLRRKCTVTAGDTVGTDTFDPATQWDGFAVDTFDGLGAHCP